MSVVFTSYVCGCRLKLKCFLFCDLAVNAMFFSVVSLIRPHKRHETKKDSAQRNQAQDHNGQHSFSFGQILKHVQLSKLQSDAWRGVAFAFDLRCLIRVMGLLSIAFSSGSIESLPYCFQEGHRTTSDLQSRPYVPELHPDPVRSPNPNQCSQGILLICCWPSCC